MTFSENLIRERKARNLSQEKLAELVGVSRQTVSQWENGYTEPDLTRLRRLAELFDLSLDELVEGPRPKVEPTQEEPADAWRVTRRGSVYTIQWEYKSRHTLFGLPLVHIRFGRGVATGILAIGNVARGVVAIGAISAGLLSFGGVSVGLLLSLGGLSVGSVAVGGLSVGGLALGGLAVGIYALGGFAVGARVAAGGAAMGAIAIGDQPMGETVFDIKNAYPEGAVRAAILSRFPGTPDFLVRLFEALL